MADILKIRPGGQWIKNLVLYAGDTYTSPAYTIKEGDTTVDASLDTWKILIEDTITGTDFVTLTNGSGITFPSQKMQWKLTAVQTEAMVLERAYNYDIQRTRADGVVKTTQKGTITVTNDTTPP